MNAAHEPLDVTIVLGSPTPPGRFHSAMSWLEEQAQIENSDLVVRLVDLRECGAMLIDGRPPEAYGEATAEAVQAVIRARAVLFASPIYRASYTGLLKDFLDLLPVDALLNKPVAIAGMGASKEHYLALESQLRPVLAWFGALVTPVAAYLRNDHFVDGQLGEEGQDELRSLLASLVQLMRALPDTAFGPQPLAARYMKPAASKAGA